MILPLGKQICAVDDIEVEQEVISLIDPIRTHITIQHRDLHLEAPGDGKSRSFAAHGDVAQSDRQRGKSAKYIDIRGEVFTVEVQQTKIPSSLRGNESLQKQERKSHRCCI